MNLPNKLSILRIVLVPLIMFFYLATFIPYGKIVAIVLFIAAALTDMFDGKIARKKGLVTDLGKLLDPIADKMLITLSLLVVVIDGTIAHPWGIIAFSILFTRDCIVNGVRQVAALNGVAVAASWSGKVKAILAYIYIPMFMFLAQLNILGYEMFAGSAIFDTITLVFSILCYVVMGAATLITAYSAVDYVVRNKAVILPNETTKDEEKEEKIEQVKADEIVEENEKQEAENAEKEDDKEE